MKKIILASGSPRRKELLQMAGIDFDVKIIPTEETYPAKLSPSEITIHIARGKAFAIENEISANGDAIIIAADTIVVLDNEIIGKPKDREDAIKMLQKLSGRTHEVITGVVILSTTEISFSTKTEVTFLDLTLEQIIMYIDQYQPYDKAGAYAIQEWIGLVGIKSINGDYYNVVGLPVSRLMKELEQINK
ncbi:MAG: Maf family nucleotide pyrophosphatase [Ginsengibacter sp.]